MTQLLEKYLEFAKEIAWEAGKLTLGYFQAGVRPEWKDDDSPVTIADKQAEKLIRERIEAKFPSHAILGEEFEAVIDLIEMRQLTFEDNGKNVIATEIPAELLDEPAWRTQVEDAADFGWETFDYRGSTWRNNLHTVDGGSCCDGATCSRT